MSKNRDKTIPKALRNQMAKDRALLESHKKDEVNMDYEVQALDTKSEVASDDKAGDTEKGSAAVPYSTQLKGDTAKKFL